MSNSEAIRKFGVCRDEFLLGLKNNEARSTAKEALRFLFLKVCAAQLYEGYCLMMIMVMIQLNLCLSSPDTAYLPSVSNDSARVHLFLSHSSFLPC